MQTIEIKRLSKEDIAHLAPLAQEYRQAHETLKFKDDYKNILIKYFEELLEEKEKVAILAKVNDEIAGIIVGTIDNNSRLMLPEKIGYIPLLVVLKKYRRIGIGSKLTKELIGWFKEKGIDLVELYTSIANKNAREFWEKNGFGINLERRFKEI
ncbi:GNAT family N-acetyltransferase [Caloranaerobacter ferrireducens]|uniref:GNAT family N-acetyltransferase n=1 Tax=Caloranaerobacter ferrireducens TaxID=1323370 RepID=UPI00084CFB18|nr:GNAT family N-acetyltransferase [Caloranaerobacter ferrireducens]